jgi:NAD(P)-dependent dehydrogenase (short-subunit alcohol dehydrogenase family)
MKAEPIDRDGLKSGDLVLVTGAGGGFGRALCLRFASLGARVAGWDRREDWLRETQEAVGAAGGTFFPDLVDLADPAAIESAVEALKRQAGDCYLLMNNASIFPRADPLRLPLADFRRTFDVNVTAPFDLSRRLAPAMIEAKRGVIINIASGRALQGAVEGASYAASKAALVSLTKTLALAWARHNVRVNAIVPGVSLTAQPLEAGGTVEELLARGKEKIPLGRIGMPEDVAGLAAFLASPDASFMTGQTVAINGGAIMTP